MGKKRGKKIAFLLCGGAAVTLSAVAFFHRNDLAAWYAYLKIQREMGRRAESIRVFETRDAVEVPVDRLARSLYRFAYDLRAGSIWAWGRYGRPTALMVLEKHRSDWSYELISLSTGNISAVLPDGRRWTPGRPGLKLDRFPNAPTPAEGEAGRLSQMGRLAAQFAATRNRGEALRLLPQPVFRYADLESGVADGAIFLLCLRANPEIALVIESRRLGASKPAWHYAMAPLTGLKAEATLNGRVVWRKSPTPYGMEPANPYTCFTVPNW